MATPFIDSFDGAGSTTNLSAWTPTGGTAWTLGGGSAGAITVQTAGELRLDNTTVSYFVCDDQANANHYVEFTQGSLRPANNQLGWVACRLVDAGNFVGVRNTSTGSTGMRVSECISGTVTDLMTFQGTAGMLYRLECSGSSADLLGDGSPIGSTMTLSGSTSETSQGVVNRGGNNTVNWILDFEAGALGGGGSSGTGSATVAAVTASGAGKLSHTGTGALSTAPITASGAGTLTHKGSGALTSLAATLAGAGVITHVGSGALAVGLPTVAGEGTVSAAGLVTGSGALAVAAITASGAGTLAHVGSGALQSSVVALAGAGVLTHSGTGDLTTGAVALAGDGSVIGTITGSGALTVGSVTASGYDSAAVATAAGGGGIGHGSSTKRKPRMVSVPEYESPAEVIRQIEAAYSKAQKKKPKKRPAKTKPPTATIAESPREWANYYDAVAANLAEQRERDAMRALVARAMLSLAQEQETMQRLEAYQVQQYEESFLMLLMAA